MKKNLFLFSLSIFIIIGLNGLLINKKTEKVIVEEMIIPTIVPTPTKAPPFECKNKEQTVVCNRNNDKNIWLCSTAYYCLDEE